MTPVKNNLRPLSAGVIAMTIVLLSGIRTCEKVEPQQLLKLRTDTIFSVTAQGFTITGQLISLGETDVIEHGFLCSKNPDPDVGNALAENLGGRSSTGTFLGSFSNLEPGTRYYARAFATDGDGTQYGAQKSVTTQSATLPTLTTSAVSGITKTAAFGGGVITDDGGSEISARGTCWGTSHLPTVEGPHTTDGSGTGSYQSSLSGLSCNTTYYVRAYATNAAGTIYGNEVSFSTLACDSNVPVVETNAASEITQGSAILGGSVTDDGGLAISERGVIYATSPDSIAGGIKLVIGTGTGTFFTTVSGLSNGTTYYFTAFATNSGGTSYGAIMNFQTLQASFAPEVETNPASLVQETSAVIMGTVTNDGGSPVTDRGFYFGTSGQPASNGTQVSTGSGTGSFSASLTSLEQQTTYYYVAYAVNSEGTSFGETLQFTTGVSTDLPAVSTIAATAVTETSALVGGNVSGDGGGTVVERGIYYGLTSDPVLEGTRMVEGSGSGIYTVSLSGLSPGTRYYYVSFATNEAGTAYGDVLNFTTGVFPPSVATNAATNITVSSADVGGTVTDNGGGTVSERGIYYGTSADPFSSGTKIQSGSGTGTFTTPLSSLMPSTRYYFVSYAVNEAGTALGSTLYFETQDDNTVSDFEGNIYGTVQIGSQVWMAENLKSTRYANGTSIPHVESSVSWASMDSEGEAYCWYDNSSSYKAVYGALYSWAAATAGQGGSSGNPSGIQGVCPDGWHLPSDGEWKELEIYLGMSGTQANEKGWRGTNEGDKLKEQGTSHWYAPNQGIDTYGFTALPGGGRASEGNFGDLRSFGRFWSASEESASGAFYRSLSNGDSKVYRNSGEKTTGLSVRCVKD